MLSNFLKIFILIISVNVKAESKKMVLPKILSDGSVVIGETVESKIKSEISDFKIYSVSDFSRQANENSKNHPMAVTEDFNGDDYRDIVVYGYSESKKSSVVLAAISDLKTKNFKIINVLEVSVEKLSSDKNETYLTSNDFTHKGVKRKVFLFESIAPGAISSTTFYFSKKSKNIEVFRGSLD